MRGYYLAYRTCWPHRDLTRGAYASVLPGAGADADIADLKHADDGKRVARAYGLFHLPGNRALGVELYKRLSGWLADRTLAVRFFAWL